MKPLFLNKAATRWFNFTDVVPGFADFLFSTRGSRARGISGIILKRRSHDTLWTAVEIEILFAMKIYLTLKLNKLQS